MPELPEVETVRRTLEPIVQGKTIKDLNIHYSGIIKEPSDTKAFQHLILNQTFQKIGRLGKFLLFYLDDNVLVSHLRMEGKYGVYEQDEPIDKHTHVVFTLSDGKELRYRDVRKFGTMHLKTLDNLFKTAPLNKLGVEPFSEAFTVEHLYQKLQKTTRKIKPALLDQTIVTGLGNIYVDEALFWSHVHPERISHTISFDEAKQLHQSIKQVLQEAVERGGSSIRSYLNSLGEVGMFQLKLAVYGKEGEACKVCRSDIEKIKVGGRGTHFCPHCQPLGD
ncbi:DNA-formamidopyrimidine glycosylase [Tenuibacillus multivorans]|uniref:Formamidopyrimidine-DNA glycosylase n=1 Tax=Tenuibacillus multivorans TaxID=237069 RepID=A0A1G9ZTR6_9BACI|nr:DNA-formamidopyrimidine glycosylase [Tenuibacillus multivorans]GEL76836.1 formamidopyrimidine-DNA glycosylase [Tenuibacillus multivorans]SDN24311.1 formamidopyrimidine-DNA glycosylase [Tenuibacillus multivorans]